MYCLGGGIDQGNEGVNMKDDFFDDLVFMDLTMGLDETKCPKCGETISSSMIMDDEVTCPKCGETFRK